MAYHPHVLKLGGSLLELPDLHERLTRFVADVAGAPIVIVVGGGAVADWVRSYDQRFHLNKVQSHWCAVHAMQLNARMLAQSWPQAKTIDGPERARDDVGEVFIVDPLRWLEVDEGQGHGVPHRWSFTSDSIAAHVALRLESRHLTLLKSTLPDPDETLADAARRGVVDADFPQAARSIPCVRLVNLRSPAVIPPMWSPCQPTLA